MSKIRNSVYGLALGDSIAYQTEFFDFHDAIKFHQTYGLAKRENLLVSDDTQMSIALIAGIEDTVRSGTGTVSEWLNQDMQSYFKNSRQFTSQNYRWNRALYSTI